MVHTGAEGAKKVSESLKINTTLTELNMECDDKINKIEIEVGNRGLMTIDNKQGTKLEMKEPR